MTLQGYRARSAGRHRGLIVVALATAALLLGPGGAPGQAVRGPRAPQVDDIVAAWDRTDHPAVSVAVVQRGEIVHLDGYGMADLDQGTAAGPETVFDVASVSKHFTAFAVTALAQDGVLSLDDRVQRWIPELPEFAGAVTIRHLLHHTSGIRDWVELFAVAGWRFDDVITVPDILTLARHQQALNFEPGSEYAYSNTGYNLLAEVVGRASDRTFRTWMAERVFEPLGMTRTHIHDRYNEIVPGRARSYGPDGSGGWEILVNNTSAVGSSSVFTTARDMARWMANFDQSVVGGAVLEQMLTRGILTTGDTLGYAHGLTVDERDGLQAVSHGGSWRGYRAHFLRFPEPGLSVAVFAAFSTFPSGSVAQSVADVFLGGRLADLSGDAPTGTAGSVRTGPAEEALPGRMLEEYAGVYDSSELGTTYTIALEGDRLVARHRINAEQPLMHVGNDTFVSPGVRGTQTLTFERDGAEVVGYRLAGARFRGVRFVRR